MHAMHYIFCMKFDVDVFMYISSLLGWIKLLLGIFYSVLLFVCFPSFVSVLDGLWFVTVTFPGQRR